MRTVTFALRDVRTETIKMFKTMTLAKASALNLELQSFGSSSSWVLAQDPRPPLGPPKAKIYRHLYASGRKRRGRRPRSLSGTASGSRNRTDARQAS